MYSGSILNGNLPPSSPKSSHMVIVSTIMRAVDIFVYLVVAQMCSRHLLLLKYDNG